MTGQGEGVKGTRTTQDRRGVINETEEDYRKARECKKEKRGVTHDRRRGQ